MYTQGDASQVHFFWRSTIFFGEHSINSGSIKLGAHSIKSFIIELTQFPLHQHSFLMNSKG